MERVSKDTIAFHVIMHQRRRGSGDDVRFLSDGQIVSFTACHNTANNSEYTINNDSNCKIWYSQLSEMFFNEELDAAFMRIVFKDGDIKSFIDIDSAELYKICQNKKFLVFINTEFKYAFDKESHVFHDKCWGSYAKAYEYLIDCFERNDIDAIGDLLRTQNAYMLKEI